MSVDPRIAEANAHAYAAAQAARAGVYKNDDKKIKKSRQYTAFKKKYHDNPDGFMADCIAWPKKKKPAPYQLRIAGALQKHRRVAVRGPRGIGKTTTVALLVLWYALTRDGDADGDWKIQLTASVWRQLKLYLFPEIHKWARYVRWDVVGRPAFNKNELLQLEIKLSTGAAAAVASNDSETLEGAHADDMMYIIDEAKIVPDSTWDSIEGTFSSHADRGLMLAVSTPGAPIGRFYDIHSGRQGLEDWHAIHITMDDMIAAGRQELDYVEKKKRLWGENSSIYQQQVLGNFSSDDEDSVIPLSWIYLANDRWLKLCYKPHVIDYKLLEALIARRRRRRRRRCGRFGARSALRLCGSRVNRISLPCRRNDAAGGARDRVHRKALS